MNYYKRHIGDYAKKAGHLTALEHGVYTLLLDAYYDRECGPTKAEAIRQARARSTEELAAVDAVLSDFFTLTDGRYTQSRVEEEFRKAEEVARQNAEKGRKGGRPRKPKGKPNESRQLSGEKPEESQRLLDGKPNENQKKPNPLIHQSTNSEELKSANADLSPASPEDDPAAGDDSGEQPKQGRPPCPHERIIAAYHEILPELRRVREWNETRRRLLARRWSESPERQAVQWWRDYFGYVRKSEFLMGKTTGRDGRAFDCDLEWLVRPSNFAKVIEGKYE